MKFKEEFEKLTEKNARDLIEKYRSEILDACAEYLTTHEHVFNDSAFAHSVMSMACDRINFSSGHRYYCRCADEVDSNNQYIVEIYNSETNELVENPKEVIKDFIGYSMLIDFLFALIAE